MMKPSFLTRFLARFIDYTLFLMIIGILLETFSIYLTALGYITLILSIPLLWIIIESLMLTKWQKTPGKALLGIRISKISFKRAWTRSVLAGFYAFLCLIPILNLFFLYNFIKKAKMGSLAWDTLTKCELKGFSSLWRKGLALFLSFGFVTSFYFEDQWLNPFSSKELTFNFIQNQTWKEYIQDGKFKVAFPRSPTRHSTKLPIPKTSNHLPYEELKCSPTEDKSFSVSYTILPTKWIRWKSSLVLKGALGIVNEYLSPGKIITKQYRSNQPHPTLDYRLKNGSKETWGRLILIGNHLYKLEHSYIPENEEFQNTQETVASFFSSFSPIKK